MTKKIRKSFEPGDTVVLKSGGPLMTVSSVEGNEVTCRWFDKQEKFFEKQFYMYELGLDEIAREKELSRKVEESLKKLEEKMHKKGSLFEPSQAETQKEE